MWRKRLKNFFWISLLILAVGIQLWEQAQPEGKRPPTTPRSETDKTKRPTAQPPAPTAPPAKAPPKASTRTAANGFQILSGARLLDDRNNDGDSFKVSHDGQTYELRLYFVDAPEKRLHQYNGERIDHQARYFGSLSREQTMFIGLQAKDLVDKLLTTRPFRIATRWQPVFDSGRHYAFIFFEDTDEELSEILVREGLARIYTEGTNLPDGRRKIDFERHLKKLEATAKAQQKGGWKKNGRTPAT